MQWMKWILVFPMVLGLIQASELLVNTQDGQTYILDVEPEESVSALQDRISALTEDEGYIVAIPSRRRNWKPQAGTQGKYLGYPRDFLAPVTASERSDIHFILTSLANKSLITIGFMKGDLEAAGDRIDHIHPLRFLMTIFTDEELKVAIRNVRGKGWVWGQFAGGTKECLNTEASIGNITDVQIENFAKTVEINPNKIYPAAHKGNWDAFIEILIREVPRKGDHDRYDN